NSSLYLKGIQLCDFLARDLSNEILKDTYLAELNKEFGRNSLQLRLAKCYFSDLQQFCFRVVFLQENQNDSQRVYMQKPYQLSWEYIKSSDQFTGIQFHSDISVGFIGVLGLARSYLKVLSRQSYFVLRSRMQPLRLPISMSKNIVLSVKEDTIQSKPSYRNQQFWTDATSKDETHYVLKNDWGFRRFSSISHFNNTQVLPFSAVGTALRKYSKDPRLGSVSRPQAKVLLKGILTANVASMYAFINALILLRWSVEMGSIALFLNANKYVFKETHATSSDAIQLVSSKIGLTTYVIQYSNLAAKNCSMQTTADKYLIFSDVYKTTFSDITFSPLEFITTGYPYREVANCVKKPALKIRGNLQGLGATLIIGYFDESVHPGKFSLVNREHHQNDISRLAKLVLLNPKIAVIIKSQFVMFRASALYSSHKGIQDALKTGRLVDLCDIESSDFVNKNQSGKPKYDGSRNNIYPTEVAFCADICVGNAFGGTANLEVALTGNRSAIINPYNFEPAWGYLLADQNIMFSNLENFLLAVQNMDTVDLKSTDIGDWSSVIENFDPHKDDLSFKRIQKAIL
ncbi:MAG: hypothetical protein P8P29_08305, partial [Flavobacteriaceae bacterium]|nr:hypothetical protein [Flavobacteriaceae bacterium]